MSIGISLFLGRDFPISYFSEKSKKTVVMVVSGRLTFLDSMSYSDDQPVFSLSLVVIHFSDNQ